MATDLFLIFTGGDQPDSRIVDDLPRADMVIAADSGYDIAVDLGYRVDVLVGDMDSVTAEIPDHVVIERHPSDKDQTDLELALELCLREQPLRMVVVGGSGGRLDHELAIAGLLCSDRWPPTEIDWINGRARSHVIREPRTLHGDVGAILSLIPIGGNVTGLTTTGLKWDLTDATFTPGQTWGVSNVMRSPVTDIRLESGSLLAVFPR